MRPGNRDGSEIIEARSAEAQSKDDGSAEIFEITRRVGHFIARRAPNALTATVTARSINFIAVGIVKYRLFALAEYTRYPSPVFWSSPVFRR